MRLFKEIVIPEYKKQIEDKTLCDFCQLEIIEEIYKINEVTISHREGDNYPGGGYTNTSFVDMCEKCFKEKLVPWIKSQGVELQKTESDW